MMNAERISVWHEKTPRPMYNGKRTRAARRKGIRTRWMYPDGTPIQYGVWNGIDKRFVFGICEQSYKAAERMAWDRIGDAYRKWRYEIMVIPFGWVNPKNPVQY